VQADAKRTLTTGRVVFLVIAAAAPMAAMVGNVPLALIRGDGIGLPAAFVVATAVLLCFCAAYSAMTRLVANGGAFYLLVARALGKPAGAASAYIAVVGYGGNAMGLSAAFGYFSSLVIGSLGIHVAWWAGWVVAVVAVGALGYRSIDVSAKVLGILITLEFGVLIFLDVLIAARHGGKALPLASFSPGVLVSGALGISVMFAFTSFIGFESAALYGEETRDPGRSIPRAAYSAVSIIAVFYVLTSWLLIGGAGGKAAPALAHRETGNFVFALAQQYGGTVLYDASAVLLCTSLLASTLALHNATARYAFALGFEGVLPRGLCSTHAKHMSPHVASLTVSGLTVLLVGGFGLLRANPYLVIATSLVGVGTLGIILLQVITALSVLAFFWRRDDRSAWSGIIAPAIAFLGLGSAFILATVHYSTLTGSKNRGVDLVPLLLIVTGAAGVAVSLLQRARRPAQYATFAASHLRTETESASLSTGG
jgi:amino acid transporter